MQKVTTTSLSWAPRGHRKYLLAGIPYPVLYDLPMARTSQGTHEHPIERAPKNTVEHPISGLTRVCHSLGISLGTLSRLVRTHTRITPPGKKTLYSCGATQLSQAATFPGRAPEDYSGIHRAVCEVVEGITTTHPIVRARAVGEYTGPYRATQENWPRMFGSSESVTTMGDVLRGMGISFTDLAKRVQAHHAIIERAKTLGGGNPAYGCSAAIISGAAFKPGKDEGSYQSIHVTVCAVIEELTGYKATQAHWPRMTTETRARRTTT